MTIDKKLIDALNDQNTIVIIQDGGIDGAIAERWLRAHAPKVVSDERVYDTIKIPHLQASQTVIAVFRSPNTPAQDIVTADQGRMLHRARPEQPKGDDPGTFSEIVVTPPVKVGDFWQRTNPRQPGYIDVPAFMAALQPTLIPLRLDWADKGMDKPTELKLRPL